MTQNRAIRVVATGARLLVGTVIAVGCVAGVTAAVALPWPGAAGEPAQVAVTPTAGNTTQVCNGAFRAIGRNSQDAAQQASAGSPALTVDSIGPREDSELVMPGLDDATAPQRFIGSGEDEDTVLIGAAESITLDAPDLTGLAASACRETRTESWLVGGAVETGTNDLIILSNPGDVAATATLTVFGLEQTSTKTVVPAGTQTSVPLSSIASGIADPVVRITAAGAPLRAALQSSLIRTLDPSGVDLQDSASSPQPDLAFAGVQVITASADSSLTVLRLMATSEATEAVITVRADGAEVKRVSVPLEEATPTQISLDGVDPGVYSVEVRADSPIVGAVRQTTRTGPGSDFTWMTPAPEIHGEILLAIPEGPDPRIHLLNDGDADATVSLSPTSGGEAEEITVSAGGDAIVDVSADTVYALTSDQAVHGAVMLTGTDAIAGWPLWPGVAAQEPIIVYP